MAATVWKGYLTFGLISVPVHLAAGARAETISFHLIHESCGSRIQMHTFCPTHDRDVPRAELIKGHEVEDGRYVFVDQEELQKIAPASSKMMEVLEFVKLEEVDPIYFDMSYYVLPDPAGEKAYYLLAAAMEEEGYVGIARLTMHQREDVVIVRPALGGLLLHTIYYANEVREVDDFGKPAKTRVNDKELEMARAFINTLKAKFEPDKYHDEYQESLQKLIDAKAAGKAVTVEAAKPKLAPVSDLMAALKASIEHGKKGKHPEQPEPKVRARRTTRAKR
ncbi:MAG: non-homologous end joining protein Ku [Candidatus Xenobia bacterium]